MNSTHLPVWGPYSKHLAGATRVTDADRGRRVEFCFYPALYRRRQNPPFLAWDSGFSPWEASPDLGSWSFRFPLTDKREFYADIRYTRDGGDVNVTARFVNGTQMPQAAALHGLVTRRFAEQGPYRQPPLRPASVTLPDGAVWRSGADYASIRFREDAHDRHLPADARPVGVVWRNGMVAGRGLGDGFGDTPGDEVRFDGLPAAARVVLRFRAAKPTPLRLSGIAETEITLPATENFETLSLQSNNPGAGSLILTALGDGGMELDGFAMLPDDTEDPVFDLPPLADVPEIETDANRITLQYPGEPGVFEIEWPETLPAQIREVFTDRLEYDFPLATHDHVRQKIGTPGEKHYTNLFLRPIALEAGETREYQLRIHCTLPAPPVFAGTPAAQPPPAPFGVERLRATLLTNVVFPVHYKRGFIAHHCPGKFWDSLYTWDSGFIGMGMCELNPSLAEEILSRYLAEEGEDFAYVHHGSTVPVQIHLLQVLFNASGGDMALLRKYFRPARRIHRFLAGRAEGSVTAEPASGLLCPFRYFYNSGGWDDYPPQWKLWKENRDHGVTPVITTAQIIRTAKLLRRVALLLDEDTDEFDQDIARLTEALFAHSWNPSTGWFSYVAHDARGQALGPMLHESGEDCNAGLDGLYPLLAGVCDPEMESEFVARLKDPQRFWSHVGLSTVDMSAAVYKQDGYWNGSVWMPHQWFVWRYLLDIGEADFALAIAERALEVWEREVRESWCCFEHFPIDTGRGAGWHHFGGLSAPILNWHATLHQPGKLTGGYNTWVLSQHLTDNNFEAEILLDGRPEDTPVLLLVHPGKRPLSFHWTGKGALTQTEKGSLLLLRFSRGSDRGVLRVEGG